MNFGMIQVSFNLNEEVRMDFSKQVKICQEHIYYWSIFSNL